jgi:4-hydroxybenzoate polyprenyltransferase
MNWVTLLRLGRISNLPTVWTNVLAGAVLSGAKIKPVTVFILLLALSLFYIAGMYLNDAFDQEFDRVAYPQRPIPSCDILARTVFIIGFLGLTTGLLILIVLGFGMEDGFGWPPALAGLCLAATIVYYDANHKHNPYASLVMALCRMQIYVTVALTLAPSLSEHVWQGAVLLFAYITGLSYIARQELSARIASLWPVAFLAAPFVYGMHRVLQGFVPAVICVGSVVWVWCGIKKLFQGSQPDIREGVSTLIAGISLLDALLIALADEPWLAGVAVAGCFLTRLGHRFIPGT